MKIHKSVPVAANFQSVKFYYPTADEMMLWRQGAVGVWADFKGTFDPGISDQMNAVVISQSLFGG